MLVWTSSRIVIAAILPVASNLQTTTNYDPAVNAEAQDQLMAEQDWAGMRAPLRGLAPGDPGATT